jgi:putative membrane protein
MNKRRDSFIEFFHYNFVNIKNNIFPFLGLAVSAFNSKNEYVFLINLIFYLLIAGIVIYSFLNWYFKTFEIKDEKIMISEGIFRKRKNDISFNRIKSVNTSDSVLKRIFKISNLNIELIGGKKVKFVINNDEIVRLKKEIMNDFETAENEVKNKKVTFFEYVLLMFSNPIIILGTSSHVLPVVSFIIKKINVCKK